MSKSCLRASLVAIVSILFLAPTPAHADTYQLVQLGSDQGYFFDGMNDLGTVVVDSPGGCGFTTCYYTFVNGVSTGSSTTAPTFTADNGTPCTPSVPAGGSVVHGVCNNGRDAFTGVLSSSQLHPGVYTGPSDFLLASGGDGNLYMNSLGDIVFDDQFSEDWYEALDLTTLAAPEPGSIVLLSTGVLALATILTLRRRRLIHA